MPRSGLRERKKAQTRRLLIDMAVELCVRQGYENTTIEQVADAVDVSPRTFSRYFASKEAVFISVIDELAEEITVELDAQPTGLGPMEALRAAHVSVLTRVAQRLPVAGLTAERIAVILQVVYSADALQQAAIEYRNPAAMAALARHMGVALRRSPLGVGRDTVHHDHRQCVPGRRRHRSRPSSWAPTS